LWFGPGIFVLVRQPIGQTEFTGIADLNDLTTMLGQYTNRINDIHFFKSVYNNQNYTYQLYL